MNCFERGIMVWEVGEGVRGAGLDIERRDDTVCTFMEEEAMLEGLASGNASATDEVDERADTCPEAAETDISSVSLFSPSSLSASDPFRLLALLSVLRTYIARRSASRLLVRRKIVCGNCSESLDGDVSLVVACRRKEGFGEPLEEIVMILSVSISIAVIAEDPAVVIDIDGTDMLAWPEEFGSRVEAIIGVGKLSLSSTAVTVDSVHMVVGAECTDTPSSRSNADGGRVGIVANVVAGDSLKPVSAGSNRAV